MGVSSKLYRAECARTNRQCHARCRFEYSHQPRMLDVPVDAMNSPYSRYSGAPHRRLAAASSCADATDEQVLHGSDGKVQSCAAAKQAGGCCLLPAALAGLNARAFARNTLNICIPTGLCVLSELSKACPSSCDGCGAPAWPAWATCADKSNDEVLAAAVAFGRKKAWESYS